MNEKTTARIESKSANAAWAAGGVLVGLALGSRRPLGMLAGLAAAASFHALYSSFKKSRREQSPAPCGAANETPETVAPATVEQKILEPVTAPTAAISPAILETATAQAFVNSMAPVQIDQPAFAPFGAPAVSPTMPPLSIAMDAIPTIWEPGNEVQSWSEAWGDTVWFGGQEFPSFNESPPEAEPFAPPADSAPVSPHVDFDSVQQILHQAASPQPSAILSECAVPTSLSSQLDELLSPMPGVTVPHLPAREPEQPQVMFVEAGAAPIECEPEHVEKRPFAEQPLAPFGDSVMALMQAFQTQQSEAVSESLPFVEAENEPTSDPVTALHTDNWATFTPSIPPSELDVPQVANEEQAPPPVFSEYHIPAEHSLDPFASDPQISSVSESDQIGSEVHHVESCAPTPAGPPHDEEIKSSPFSVCEPMEMSVIAKPQNILTQLVAQAKTSLPEPRKTEGVASPADGLPGGRKPVSLRRLVPLAPTS